MKKILRIGGVLALALMIVAIPQPALADQPTEIEHDYNMAIRMLEPFLSIAEDGSIVLDAPDAVVKNVDGEVYQSLLLGIDQTNWMADNGYLTVNSDFSLTVTDKYLESLSQEPAEGSIITPRMIDWGGGGGGGSSTYYGVSKAVWHWWGLELYLDHWDTIIVSWGFYVGGIIAAVVPEPFASKVAAIIIGGIGGIITSFDNGRGVVLCFSYLPTYLGIRSQ